MDLSMRWLRDYTDVTAVDREFSEAMSMSGSKVETYEHEDSEISNVVVGKVLSVEKHPDSDHLVICQLDVGKEEPVQIVTGASNVTPGVLVPAALDNSTLPGGTKIKKGKLRGVPSNGMMCSLGELGLTVNDFPYAIEDGIFLIEEECEVGQDICSALGLNDLKVEFEITSNRPDCLSVIGLAREAAATFGKTLNVKAPVVSIANDGDDIHNYIDVTVSNPELCPRYTCKAVKNVKIGPSPRWMRERLRASGVRPINNLVDITNFVMLEYGQPMHAFDYRFVKDHKIDVRNAKAGEKIVTLDGVEHELTEDMLVIADSEKPVAVAGVMGGENSGIVEDTNTVIFESANFKGSSVRITAKNLGMRTDASGRFEKGLNATMTEEAVLRACELVEMLGVGEVVDGMIDVCNADLTPISFPFTPEWISKFLGVEIPTDRQIAILNSLGFEIEDGNIVVPYFRTDIHHKADVAEEVARIYGYNNIPTTAIRGVANARPTERQVFDRTINEVLLGCGLSEVQTYSFVSPKVYDRIGLPVDSTLRNSVVISNPLGEDTSVMRTTIIPSVLDVLSRNYNNRNEHMWCYEIGREYIPTQEGKLPNENNMIAIGMYENGADYFALKGIVETLLKALNVTDIEFEAVKDNPTFHPGQTARVFKGDVEIGIIGQIHPRVAANYEIGTKAFVANLSADKLFDLHEPERQYAQLPKFPASSRDLALVCDKTTPVAKIEKIIRGAAGKHLEAVKLFDVYEGEHMEKGKKSVAYTIVLRNKQNTLTDEEVDNAVKRVLKALAAEDIVLRS